MFTIHTSLPAVVATLGKINPESSSIDLLFLQIFHALLRASHVRKVRMCETPRLTRSSIDRDSDICDIPNVAEKFMEVLVGHVKGHVADEESPRWRMRLAGSTEAGKGISSRGVTGGASSLVLDAEASAGKGHLVELCYDGAGGRKVGHFDIAESVGG